MFEQKVNEILQSVYGVSLREVKEVFNPEEELLTGEITDTVEETAEEIYNQYCSYFDNSFDYGCSDLDELYKVWS